VSTTYTQQATATQAGDATVTFTAPAASLVWTVRQITVETSTAGRACTATVRLDGRYVTATDTGSGDAAVGPPDLDLVPGASLTITWAGAPSGALCTAVLTVDEVPR